MIGRRRIREPELVQGEPTERLQGRLQDIFAENMLPANRVGELLSDIALLDLAAAPVVRGRPNPGNAARDLGRAWLRGSRWPQPYTCMIRFRDVRTDTEQTTRITIALPHEYLFCLHAHGNPAKLYDSAACDPLTLNHLHKCQEAVGCPLIALGLWGDGVPIQWERTESIETIAMDFAGITGPHQRLRLSLVSIADKHISEHTWGDISEVLAWSFRHCVLGTWPTCRHDGTPWSPEDRQGRGRSWAGRHVARTVHARGVLCEVRMDWKYYVSLFGFPAHNLLSGNCWRCAHTPAQARHMHLVRGMPRLPIS